MKIFTILKSPYLWVLVIVVLGFILRMYMIDRRIADWHSWRQADTAAVARNFYQEGYNPFLPRGDDMTPPGGIKVNLERYRFVEFPIYPSFVYFAYLLNGRVEVTLARFVSVLFSLGSIVFIYLIVKRYWSTLEALLASFLFAVLPFNVYFSRTTLPELSLVFFCLGMFYFTDKWIYENKLKLFFLSVFFTACAFLTKPMAIFYLLPLIYSYLKKEQKIFPIPLRYFLWAIPSFAPLVAWRTWMSNFPEGIPASEWLYNGNNIRFRPAFFRWIINDRLGREILSVTGTVLFTIGLIRKAATKENYLLHFLALSMFLYLVVFATGNVQHNYYQVLIIPSLVMFMARGLMWLIRDGNGLIPRLFSIPLALFLLVISLGLSFYEVRGFYQINNDGIVKAGEYADKALPKDAIVVAPMGGDTSFLYQINRHGFAAMISSLEGMRNEYNVSYLISVDFNDGDTKRAIEEYTVVERNKDFVVIDLTKKK